MPTTTIAYGDIEDTYVNSNIANNNYGANAGWPMGLSGVSVFRALIRVDETKIPSGTITGFRLKFYQASNANSDTGGTLNAYRVKAANDWVEGTHVAGQQAGSSSWNSTKDGVAAWAGAGGCNTSGTDYIADASPPDMVYPAYTSGANVLRTYTLPVAWASDWRDAVIANEGMMIKEASETVDFCRALSTENGSDEPYFEVDTLGGALFTGCNF